MTDFYLGLVLFGGAMLGFGVLIGALGAWHVRWEKS